MRVLYLTDSLSDLDGVGRYSVDLITAVEKLRPGLGVDVLLARKHRPTSSAVPAHWNVRVGLPPDYFFHMHWTRFWPSLAAAALSIARAATHVDVVHAIKDYPHNLAGLLGARIARKPCIATAHGTYSIQPLFDPRHAKLARWCYPRFDAVIAVSSFTARRLLQSFEHGELPVENVKVIHNAVNVEPFEMGESSERFERSELAEPVELAESVELAEPVEPVEPVERAARLGRAPGAEFTRESARAAVGPSGDRAGARTGEPLWRRVPFTLSIGELKERKGHHVALAAWCALAPRHPELHHFVVGRRSDDAYQAGLEALVARAGLAERVHFLGNVTEAEKIDLLQRARVFVHTPVTSRDGGFEGFGIVYLEAAAAGTPSVGTRDSGAEDAVLDGVTGLLVEPSPQAVEEGLERLLSDPDLRRRMGTAAREQARRSSWDANARAVLDVYDRALA